MGSSLTHTVYTCMQKVLLRILYTYVCKKFFDAYCIYMYALHLSNLSCLHVICCAWINMLKLGLVSSCRRLDVPVYLIHVHIHTITCKLHCTCTLRHTNLTYLWSACQRAIDRRLSRPHKPVGLCYDPNRFFYNYDIIQWLENEPFALVATSCAQLNLPTHLYKQCGARKQGRSGFFINISPNECAYTHQCCQRLHPFE